MQSAQLHQHHWISAIAPNVGFRALERPCPVFKKTRADTSHDVQVEVILDLG
jgi:hypothetical protein